jgi:hypothetical protein
MSTCSNTGQCVLRSPSSVRTIAAPYVSSDDEERMTLKCDGLKYQNQARPDLSASPAMLAVAKGPDRKILVYCMVKRKS